MAESKTARQSMMAGMVREGKKDPFDTPEKKIAELRKQRTDKLFVNRMDFVDALLESYDTLVHQMKEDRDTIVVQRDGAIAERDALQVQLDEVKSNLRSVLAPSGSEEARGGL